MYLKNNVKEYYKIFQFYLKEKMFNRKVEHLSIRSGTSEVPPEVVFYPLLILVQGPKINENENEIYENKEIISFFSR